MPDWIAKSFNHGHTVHTNDLAWRLVLSAVLGFAIAGIYWLTHRRDESLSMGFISTLVLLAILVAMVTQVIGESVARAFSLVGALSIVRFRTVVEDTRDTAFVIFSVIVGMAVGAGRAEVALVGLVVVGCAALLTRPRRAAMNLVDPGWSLSVRVGIGQAILDVLGSTLREYCAESDLLTTGTARQGAALELTYKVRLRPASDPIGVVGALNRLEGVQNVELRRV